MSDKHTMAKLLMPKTKELSNWLLLSALMRKNREPKLNTPRATPINNVLKLKSCSPGFFVNINTMEHTKETANKDEEKSCVSSCGIYQC